VRPRALLVALCLTAGAAGACGGAPPPPPKEEAPAEARWEDAFDTLPELLVVVRAKAAREDRIYGPLLHRALVLAREQNKAVGATSALEAMSDAQELVLSWRPDTIDGPGEQVVVASGVRADVDPATLVDDGGQPLWAAGPSGRVRELVRDRDEHGHPVGASLFELPGRTWVIAQGPARERARQAFAHPFGRPPIIDIDPQALAFVRIDGPSLVTRARPLQDLGGLAAVGHHLRSILFSLRPGAEHTVAATLAYADDDAAGTAEVALQEVVGAVRRTHRPATLAWLASAQLQHGVKTVAVTAPLPAQLLEALLHAGSAPLDLEVPPSSSP
jgi:hypothetical protein